MDSILTPYEELETSNIFIDCWLVFYVWAKLFSSLVLVTAKLVEIYLSPSSKLPFDF